MHRSDSTLAPIPERQMDDDGTLLLFDTTSKSQLPQQFRVLSFEFGGISELFWINSDILVVGTTRGFLVVYSLANDARCLFEMCHVKAHGDGVSQVAVQCIEYNNKSKCLASVGQGSNSIRLWDVADDGTLIPQHMKSGLIAYDEPRFVAFGKDGLTFRTFSLSTWDATDHILGHEAGVFNDRQLGNALLLDDGRLIIFNVKDGLDIYDSANFNHVAAARFEINGCCSQAISTLRNGSYILSPSKKGYINIFHATNTTRAGRIYVKANRSDQVQAIHSITDISKRDVVVAISCAEGHPSRISVWAAGSQKSQSGSKIADYSTARIVLLSIFVYGLCHLATSILAPLALSRSTGRMTTFNPAVLASVPAISDLSTLPKDEDGNPIYIRSEEGQLGQFSARNQRPWGAITW
ncbi:hypothetical protein GALMADRAFT_141038 [Galerina marginata CBS 339.88]|uniref:WD40 repeat-like protein n=1 Tax=Galerina marginata (strain CBS 339.88) TaxID=685588 RepID=A0A067T6N8_GALM3|nr:hypothetical protein GALMADRAFT_141038 [Galerina marginata CBS 339.88]